MLKFEQLMDGSYFENAELSESHVATLFDQHAIFKEIIRTVIGLDEVNLNIFGNYLYYSFFAETPDEGALDFTVVDVISMLTELDDYNIYQDVNTELKHIVADPEYFMEIPFENDIGLTDVNDFDNSELEDDYSEGDYSEGEISESKIQRMTLKKANKKKRTFFKLSKAQLLRNKPKNRIKNLENRPNTRMYRNANAPFIKRYQFSRNRLMTLGIHHDKLRRPA